MHDAKAGPGAVVTHDRYYAIIRQQIEHEDNLTGQRLSWLVAAQSFLFTAYAITIANAGPSHAPAVTATMRLLTWLIPVTSIITCALIYASSVSGAIAIARLRALYRDYANHEAMKGYPPIQGYRRTQILGQLGPMLIPPVFMCVWIVLLTRGTLF